MLECIGFSVLFSLHERIWNTSYFSINNFYHYIIYLLLISSFSNWILNSNIKVNVIKSKNENYSNHFIFTWVQKNVYLFCIFTAFVNILLSKGYRFNWILRVISFFLHFLILQSFLTKFFIIIICLCIGRYILFCRFFKNISYITSITNQLSISLTLIFLKFFCWIFKVLSLLSFKIYTFPVIPLELHLFQLICCNLKSRNNNLWFFNKLRDYFS